ncbi:MAG: hypothetical protein QF645_09290, partial [Planctomycetota bacterium]|nr:hypothetical protein [Planctomycetota bacterium]
APAQAAQTQAEQTQTAPVQQNPTPQAQPKPAPLEEKLPAQKAEPSAESWTNVVQEVKAKSVLAGTLLGEGKVLSAAKQEIVFELPAKFTKFHIDQLESAKNKSIIEEIMKQVYGRPCALTCRLESNGSGEGAPKKGPAPQKDLTADPMVKKVLDVFGGKIVGVE